MRDGKMSGCAEGPRTPEAHRPGVQADLGINFPSITWDLWWFTSKDLAKQRGCCGRQSPRCNQGRRGGFGMKGAMPDSCGMTKGLFSASASPWMPETAGRCRPVAEWRPEGPGPEGTQIYRSTHSLAASSPRLQDSGWGDPSRYSAQSSISFRRRSK